MEKTLTQIGQDLSAAAQTLSWWQRKEMGAALWESLGNQSELRGEKVSDDARKTSGSSPQLAESGATILTGRSLQEDGAH
jgi:hypothetical protein